MAERRCTAVPERVTREELAEAAKAWRDLDVCYRTGKGLTENLFDRLHKADDALSRLEAEREARTEIAAAGLTDMLHRNDNELKVRLDAEAEQAPDDEANTEGSGR